MVKKPMRKIDMRSVPAADYRTQPGWRPHPPGSSSLPSGRRECPPPPAALQANHLASSGKSRRTLKRLISIIPYHNNALPRSRAFSNGSFCERGGSCIISCFGWLCSQSNRGDHVGSRSIANTIITVIGSGIIPRENRNTINGTASAMLLLNT